MNFFRTPERGVSDTGLGPSTSDGRRQRRLDFGTEDGQSACEGACAAPKTCAICLSPLKKKNGECHKGPTFVLPCNHEFHRECLQNCREFKTSCCPLCRAELPPGLTPVGARERQAEREREEEVAYNFNIAAEYNRNYIAIRAARIRLAVAQRYCQDQSRRLHGNPTTPQVGASAS